MEEPILYHLSVFFHSILIELGTNLVSTFRGYSITSDKGQDDVVRDCSERVKIQPHRVLDEWWQVHIDLDVRRRVPINQLVCKF